MNPPCPRCSNRMSESRKDMGDHYVPWFVCLCGAEVLLINFYIPKE